MLNSAKVTICDNDFSTPNVGIYAISHLLDTKRS